MSGSALGRNLRLGLIYGNGRVMALKGLIIKLTVGRSWQLIEPTQRFANEPCEMRFIGFYSRYTHGRHLYPPLYTCNISTDYVHSCHGFPISIGVWDFNMS